MSANLLFLYGPSGAGKTRLLQMIAESCSEQSIMRVGSEQIVDEMVWYMGNRNFSDFFDKYTLIKNLLVDNLWILQSRPHAAEEMGRLIKARVARGNLTVLASDLVWQDVICNLPAIGRCLKEESAIHLSLVQKENEAHHGIYRVKES